MTLVILDVDGVLAPLGGVSNQIAVTDGYELVPVGPLKALLNIPRLSYFLTTLNQSTDVVWGSGWGDTCNHLLSVAGVDEEWEVIPLDLETPDQAGVTWKLETISQWVENNVPQGTKIVWVDDELQEDAHQWGNDRGNTLTIQTNPYQGLTLPLFQKILDFC